MQYSARSPPPRALARADMEWPAPSPSPVAPFFLSLSLSLSLPLHVSSLPRRWAFSTARASRRAPPPPTCTGELGPARPARPARVQRAPPPPPPPPFYSCLISLELPRSRFISLYLAWSRLVLLDPARSRRPATLALAPPLNRPADGERLHSCPGPRGTAKRYGHEKRRRRRCGAREAAEGRAGASWVRALAAQDRFGDAFQRPH